MELTETVDLPCTAPVAFAVVADLARYPAWLGIVERVEPDPTGDETTPAWLVELRGRIGPLTRSKRLRMQRIECVTDTRVHFERQELDGRSHAPWSLTVELAERDDTTEATMSLHYGGSFGDSVLRRMLRDEVERSRPRLVAEVSSAR